MFFLAPQRDGTFRKSQRRDTNEVEFPTENLHALILAQAGVKIKIYIANTEQ